MSTVHYIVFICGQTLSGALVQLASLQQRYVTLLENGLPLFIVCLSV